MGRVGLCVIVDDVTAGGGIEQIDLFAGAGISCVEQAEHWRLTAVELDDRRAGSQHRTIQVSGRCAVNTRVHARSHPDGDRPNVCAQREMHVAAEHGQDIATAYDARKRVSVPQRDLRV